MTPKELFDACMERIEAWNAGEQFTDEPTLALTLQRPRPPSGDTVRLWGRSGPRGRLATCRPRDGGWMVVAYFPAVPIVRDIARELGVDLKIDVAPKRPDPRIVTRPTTAPEADAV